MHPGQTACDVFLLLLPPPTEWQQAVSLSLSLPHLEIEDKDSIDPLGLMGALSELTHVRCLECFLAHSHTRSLRWRQPRQQWCWRCDRCQAKSTVYKEGSYVPVASKFEQGKERDVGFREGFMENLALNWAGPGPPGAAGLQPEQQSGGGKGGVSVQSAVPGTLPGGLAAADQGVRNSLCGLSLSLQSPFSCRGTSY